MTYENALEKIHSLLTFGSRPGLDRMRELLRRMGDPQDKLQYIHVAGTNGKGSVCAMLSAALVAAGYRTGLFISPYITDFRERIQINNEMISREALVDAVEKTFPLIEQLRAEDIIITEFEYVNALQFYLHAQAQCDVVVLETGMGGLLDCTNVIAPPLCAVITTIGLDHTAILGDTIEQIAEQKCGILKERSLAVTSAQEQGAMQVIERTAQARGIALLKSADVQTETEEMSLFGSVLTYRGEHITIPLAGDHQIENAKTALAVLEALDSRGRLSVPLASIRAGFAKAVNPARLETLGKQPLVLLDGAHNPNGIGALRQALERFLPHRHILCVMGMLADKDIDAALALLDGVFDKILTVPVNNPRAISAEALAEKCLPYAEQVHAFDNAQAAIDCACEQADKTDAAVLICGSLYLAGEVRPYLLKKFQG